LAAIEVTIIATTITSSSSTPLSATYECANYHRLRSSGSTVVTMTSKVNGKMEILTPCRSETPENIEAKLGKLSLVIPPWVGECVLAKVWK